MTLDYCGRTFGVSPCLATGEKCYNTWPTCKYKTAYLKQSKDYRLTSAGAALPFETGERPYLKNVKYLPTEIATSLTVAGRVTLELLDDQDTDMGIDPYYASRASLSPASFWKRFYARNRNYKGRLVKIYEGFLGLSEAEFSQKWIGKIENLTVAADGSTKIECIDLLKGLKGTQAPPKLDIKLLNDVDAAQTDIVLYTPNTTQVTGLDTPSGHVRIGDEIIQYTGFDQAQNRLTGCTRGYYNTAATTHKANDRVQKCRYYAPENPFEILKAMLLTDAALDSAYVDTAAFDYWKTFPITDENFSAMISEPTDLEKLYFEIVEMLDCKSWVGEDLKITIRRNVPNEPGRAYAYLSDAGNVVQKSMKVDANEKSRATRVVCYWDPKPIGKQDDASTYQSIDMAVDADAESENEYGDVIEKKLFCRWLRADIAQYETLAAYVRNQITRILFRYRDAEPIIDFQVELKDMDVKTGAYAIISTDAVLDRLGNAVDDVFQLVRREKVNVNTVGYRALRLSQKRIGFIAPADTPDFSAQSDAQKEYGSICDIQGLIGDAERSYHIY
jgi:hypothetical protein